MLIKKVPAQVYENSGECFLSKDVSAHIFAQAEEAIKRKINAVCRQTPSANQS
jgi:hypothetical protein